MRYQEHAAVFAVDTIECCPPASTNMRITIPKNRESSGTDELYIVRLASG